MAQNKQLHLIAGVKMLNIDFMNKHTIKGIVNGGYLVLVNYQSLVLNFFPLAPSRSSPSIYFSL